MLFCVVTRGFERMRPLPVVSSAESATSRLNAPFTDPSARPTALVAADAGRLTAVGTLGTAPVPVPCTVPARPAGLPLFGEARFVVLPSAGSTRPPKPLLTP